MKAIILAGGKGRRLAPFTTVLPKPLMPIGDRPILDVLLHQLTQHGIQDIAISVGYLGSLIQAYMQDSTQYGPETNITFIREDKPLSTAGPIALVPDLDDSFLVLNGDILTTLDYQDLIRTHRDAGALMTIAVYQKDVHIDLGVIEMDDSDYLARYNERPVLHYYASMGINVFEPGILDYIETGEPLGIPDLAIRLLDAGQKVRCYRFGDYWRDVGRPEDYQAAIDDFEADPERFLSGVGRTQLEED